MARFQRSRYHEHHGLEYRLVSMDRFGEDLQDIFDLLGQTFRLRTAFSVGMLVIDVLEYVYSYEYIHARADMKASSLLRGFGKGNENKVCLVDFGLTCRCSQNGKHKKYKEDLRKVQDGMISVMTWDSDVGTYLRRGSIKILGCTMIQWHCCRLLWEDILKDPKYVIQQKSTLTEIIPLLMSKCFPHGDIPCGITEFLQYVASMKFEDTTDYIRPNKDIGEGRLGSGYQDQQHDAFHTAEDAVAPLVLAEEARAARNLPRRGPHGGERGKSVLEKPPPTKVPLCRTTNIRQNRRSPRLTRRPHGSAASSILCCCQPRF
ncbi:serine/threonine-protein kinase VRK1-like [Rhipicephalus sanguineus]|uniref:serine/threonine-protein kinase VRK1-like n=1 Tax=Rhipicephalus sanguineus TaxID=34632 RepID=UPI0018942C86|nr:serine/threonine-protein kinase VRK1-like [Rhipicephalus sanguineus]